MKTCRECGEVNEGKHLLFCKECRNKKYFGRKAKECPICKTKYLANGVRKACSNKCNILSGIEVNENGCWEWKRCKKGYGHGQIRDYETGKSTTVHRLAYKVFKANVSDNLFICHNCPNGDNPACCNPDHMFIGTCKENMQDAKKKGRTLLGNTFRAILKIEDVLNIRKEYGKENGYKKLAQKYKVHWSNIRAIIKRRSWKNL